MDSANPLMMPIFDIFYLSIAIAYSRGATWDDFSGHFFRIFEIIIFCFVVGICDLVQDVATRFHLSYLLTASGNLFCKLQFHGHHSYFRKDFQMLLTLKECHM